MRFFPSSPLLVVIIGAHVFAAACDPPPPTLTNDDVYDQQALHTFERIRYPRTSFVTKRSWSIGRMTSWSSGVACALRNGLLRSTPQRSFGQELARFAAADFAQALVALPHAEGARR